MTPAAWAEHARAAVDEVRAVELEWTTDDVWDQLDRAKVERPPAPWTPRALGNVLSQLARAGAIEKTGAVRPSRRSDRNHGMVAVWSEPGLAGCRDDAVPCTAWMRGQVAALAAARGESLKDCTERLLKEALAGAPALF